MSDSKHLTHTIDAAGKPLGRLASQVATLLIGKRKRGYAPEQDLGDYVVVQNVSRVQVTGRKLEQKVSRHFSGYPGGLKEVKWGILLSTNPKKVLRDAVARMLPKNRLQRARLNRLTIE